MAVVGKRLQYHGRASKRVHSLLEVFACHAVVQGTRLDCDSRVRVTTLLGPRDVAALLKDLGAAYDRAAALVAVDRAER